MKESNQGKFEIIGIGPPKHFYLDLKNVRTGSVYKRVYVSQHYNDCGKLKVGMKIIITYTTFEYSDGSARGGFDSTEILEALGRLN